MPAIHVVFYQEKPGDSAVVNWFEELRATQRKAFSKCRAALARLALLGHELRRPEADYLGDGLHELRIRFGSVNYRFLYFFHGQNIAVVAHGLTRKPPFLPPTSHAPSPAKQPTPQTQPPIASLETSPMPKKTTTDALQILAHMSRNDPKAQQSFEDEMAKREIGTKIYQLRERAGLSQSGLAGRVGTTQSVISRLEDADYSGHSLAMLNRIAKALDHRVEIRFLKRRPLQPA